MKVLKTKKELISILSKKTEGKTVSFVPTMGSLHKGHIALIEKAKENSDLVICSIFVNPTQFNNSNDLKNYPQTIENDFKKLKRVNCDILYHPNVEDLYSENEEVKQFDFGGLDNFMEGISRKGHFNGVATIVEKLFKIVNPDKAYFGQKDLQQLQIIKHITKQLQLTIEIIGIPTIREKSGLAMSSRNKLLSQTDFEKSALIYKTLQFIKDNSRKFEILELKQYALQKISMQSSLNLDYLEIVSLEKMNPIDKLAEKNKNVACIAASISGVRLIDNIIF